MQTQKPFLNALNSQKTKHTPFWFMRQAGRYLPEYRALRAKKGGFLKMALNPTSACEITMQPIRRFKMDAAIIFSDILTIPMGLGQKLEFLEGEGPKLDALESSSDIAHLNFNQFSILDPVYEALEKTKEALQEEGFNHTALIGFAGAPWSVATYMIEGGSSRDFMKTKMMAYQDQEGFQALIDLLVEATARYLINQVKAGAEALQIFDSWAGALDSQNFHRWSIEPMKAIIQKVHAVYPDIPIIGFPKGAGAYYLDYVRETGLTAVSIDQHLSSQWAIDNLQSQCPVQGHLDPYVLLAGGDALISATHKILDDFKDGPFIFNLGHGIHKDTPVEHVELLVGLLKETEIR